MSSFDTAKISTKEEFAAFISEVLVDYSKQGESWGNPDLPQFLEALQSWLEDSDGYYENQKIELTAVKPWRRIADALVAARIYE